MKEIKDKDKKVKEPKKVVKKVIRKKKEPKIEVPTPEKRVATFSLVEMIIVVVIVSLVVSVLSGYLVFKNYNYISSQTTNKVNYKELNEFVKIYDELKEKYVEDIDTDALINSAIDGMLNYLDAYTDYLDEDTTLDLQDRLNGEYKGIGVEITNNTDNNVVIVTVFEDTPAEEAGLMVGDIIVAVNDESMLGKTSSDVAKTIKGAFVKDVNITYRRDGLEKTVKINLSNVIIPSAEYEVLEDNIGYINLTTFSSTTASQVKNALAELEKKNIDSLIVDVRNNSGGYLNAAKEISDLFLPKGKIIYQLKDKEGIVKKYAAENNDKTTYPIVVLINGASASASEILAGALKENYGAKLIGTKSFGKGTVQETEILSNGSMIKYTSAYWLTPNGKSINEVGLEPDVLVNITEGNDEQLQSAIEALQ